MEARSRNFRQSRRGAGGRGRALGGALVAAVVGVACSDEMAPRTRVCAEILALQVPESEVVETWPGARGATFAYRIEGEDVPSVHQLGCELEEPTPGRLRAKSVRVDGRDLSEAEILLLNSELLLAEIHRADPGPPGAQRWTDWIEAALAML